jgi:hypothetical protein
MVKRLWGLLRKDLLLSWRNYFFVIELVVVLLMVGLYHFVLPDELSLETPVIVALEGVPAAALPGGDGALADARVVPDRAALEEALGENRNAVGIVISQGSDRPAAEVIFRGHESPRTREVVLLALTAAGTDLAERAPVSYVNGEPRTERMPFRRSMLPLLLLGEPALLGFLLIATLVFFEKEEGTALSYMVSPGSVWAYLASKVAAITVLSLFSATLLTGLTVFTDASWGWMLLIVAAGSVFGSATALLLASFFDTLSQAMAWITVIAVIITLPMVSYFAPALAPLAFRVSPTWPLMWGLREAFLTNGSGALMVQAIVVPLGVGIVCLVLSGFLFRRRLVA